MSAHHTTSTPPPLPTALEEDGGEESPLNAYLADAELSFDSDALGSPFKSHETVRSSRRQTPARTTSPSPITARIATAARIVPHPIDTSSSSASPAATNRYAPRTPPQQHDTTNAGPSRMAGTGGGRGSLSSAPMPFRGSSGDAFVERFQYVVASSGLLEKTQLDLSKSPRKDTLENGGPPQAHTAATAALDVPRALDAVNEALAANTRIRLDIVGAIAALLLALAYVLGRFVVLVSAAGITAAVFYLKPDIMPRTPSATPPPTSSPQPPAHKEEDGAHDHDATEQSTAVLKSLEEFIAESRDLDQSVASSLQLLSPRPEDTEQAHELRIALHRVMEDMTDSLAAATSTFVPMADRAALSVLEDMYDVSVAKNRRQRRSPSTDDDDDEESALPARRRLRPRASSHSAAGAVPDLLTGGLLTPRERAHAKSPIRGLLPSPLFDPNDKFTSLPVRTPRHRRGSWSHDWNTTGSPLQQRQQRREREHVAEEDPGNESVMSASSTESSLPASIPETLAQSSVSPPARRRVSTFMPKRGSPLAQALEQLEGTKPRGPPPSSFNAPFPVMESRGNVRRSLQDIPYIHSAPMSSADNAANLALARASATMSSVNRRSLQVVNSPQARDTMEQAIAATGVSLQRARSLPQSERGMRATKSSPNSKRSSTIMGKGSPSVMLSDRPTWSSPASKRTSLTLTEAHHMRQSDLGVGFLPLHIPRPSRVVSVSPLTLSGLKAAYFGVHSKRRRIACCLLGMRFNEDRDGEYWGDVRTALQSLTEAVTSGKERLEALRVDAEREAAAQSTIINLTKSPGTPQRFNIPAGYPGGALNFAPRDSTEQALLSSIAELQRSLARVWAVCDELRARVESGDTSDLVAEWTDMRGDVGGMLRHVERGRELARRDWQSEEETELLSDYPDDRPASPLPEFLRAWAPSPGPGAAEITRAGDDHEPLLTVDEHLPPVGVDEVFEATLPPAVSVLRPKAAMSREERIALTREARARGLSLAQLTAASSASPAEREAEARRQAEAERLRAGGEMVAELQGMFGAIRRRKGMDNDEGEGVGVGVAAEEVGVAL